MRRNHARLRRLATPQVTLGGGRRWWCTLNRHLARQVFRKCPAACPRARETPAQNCQTRAIYRDRVCAFLNLPWLVFRFFLFFFLITFATVDTLLLGRITLVTFVVSMNIISNDIARRSILILRARATREELTRRLDVAKKNGRL